MRLGDSNGDGALSEEEWIAKFGSREGHATADLNNDGVVDQDELIARNRNPDLFTDSNPNTDQDEMITRVETMRVDAGRAAMSKTEFHVKYGGLEGFGVGAHVYAGVNEASTSSHAAAEKQVAEKVVAEGLLALVSACATSHAAVEKQVLCGGDAEQMLADASPGHRLMLILDALDMHNDGMVCFVELEALCSMNKFDVLRPHGVSERGCIQSDVVMGFFSEMMNSQGEHLWCAVRGLTHTLVNVVNR